MYKVSIFVMGRFYRMVVVVAELVILDQPVQLVPVMVRRVHKGRLVQLGEPARREWVGRDQRVQAGKRDQVVQLVHLEQLVRLV
jgi:hypothetical protein